MPQFPTPKNVCPERGQCLYRVFVKLVALTATSAFEFWCPEGWTENFDRPIWHQKEPYSVSARSWLTCLSELPTLLSVLPPWQLYPLATPELPRRLIFFKIFLQFLGLVDESRQSKITTINIGQPFLTMGSLVALLNCCMTRCSWLITTLVSLPPTASALKYHSYGVYHQVQECRGNTSIFAGMFCS